MSTEGLISFKSGSGGGGGAGSGDYVKDAFLDITLPATNNTGFSSTPSTNPIEGLFANDDQPRFGVKTLWIDDLVLLDSRDWLNSKPTYKIVWTEDYPAAQGYVCGNVSILNSAQGKVLNIVNIDDIFGVSGVIRKVMFICGTTISTGTADIVIDGVDTTRDADFGGAATDSANSGYNKYAAFVSGSSNESQQIHDYRLTPNQTGVLQIVGVVVYHENATTNIDCFPGSTYVDKEKKTTSAITALGFTTISSQNGANTIVYKTNAGAYEQSIVVSPTQQSIGVGLSGTNQLQVTAGHGASFRIGDGIVVGSGSTYYVGNISNISTDTFTVGPTITFGVSNTLYRAWYSSATAIIGATLYEKTHILDIPTLQVLGNNAGFGMSSTGNFYWENQVQDVRVWGNGIALQSQYGVEGIAFSSTTGGFLQIDGSFQAAEIEVTGYGILSVHVGVNGCTSYAINDGITGILKYSVLTDAQVGWNSVLIGQGASFGNVAINKISLYGLQNPGITFGRLAEFDNMGTYIPRASVGATVLSLGTYRRVYADSLLLKGPWTRVESTAAAGGVYYNGPTTTCSFEFQWYGKDIALIGLASAGSTLVIDGAGVPSTFNSMISIGSEGFHSLTYTVVSGTSGAIQAIDYTRTKSEFRSLENRLPNGIPASSALVYQQSVTPVLSTPGTIWGQDPNSGNIWLHLFNRWYKLSVEGVSDNPNIETITVYGGFL